MGHIQLLHRPSHLIGRLGSVRTIDLDVLLPRIELSDREQFAAKLVIPVEQRTCDVIEVTGDARRHHPPLMIEN
jgi:hypothetical protein